MRANSLKCTDTDCCINYCLVLYSVGRVSVQWFFFTQVKSAE